jgi:hypothetical protein
MTTSPRRRIGTTWTERVGWKFCGKVRVSQVLRQLASIKSTLESRQNQAQRVFEAFTQKPMARSWSFNLATTAEVRGEATNCDLGARTRTEEWHIPDAKMAGNTEPGTSQIFAVRVWSQSHHPSNGSCVRNLPRCLAKRCNVKVEYREALEMLRSRYSTTALATWWFNQEDFHLLLS